MKGVHVMNKILEAAIAVGGAAIALFAGDKVFNKKEAKSNNEEVIDATTTSETTATTETNTDPANNNSAE